MTTIQRSDRKYPDPSQLTHFPLPLLQNVFSRLDPSSRQSLHKACQGTQAAQRISNYSAPILKGLGIKKQLSLNMLRKLQDHLGLCGEMPEVAALTNRYCQKVKELDLSVRRKEESEEALQCIEQGMWGNVQSLNLSRVVGFSTQHVKRLDLDFSKLARLTFQASIESDVLGVLTLHLGKRLEMLDLSCSQNVTDYNVKAITAFCRKLYELRLSLCLNVTDEGLKALYQKMPPFLVTLKVDGCPGITHRRTLIEFAKRIPFLTPVRGEGDQTACLEIYGLEALFQRLKEAPKSMSTVQLIFYALPTTACRNNLIKHVVLVAQSHGRTIGKEWAKGAFLGEEGMSIPNAWRLEAVVAAIETEDRFGLELL